MAATVRAVVFDIGNVLIRWDAGLIYRPYFAGDEAAYQRFLQETGFHHWNLMQDRGRSWADGEAEVAARLPHYADAIRQYRRHWQDSIPGAIPETVAVLEDLYHLRVPLHAITNFAADTFALTRSRFPFLERFGEIVVSGEEEVVKPEAEIYHRLLRRTGLSAGDCLFIDDSQTNIDGAARVGMRTHLFEGASGLRQHLTGLGLLPGLV